MTIMDPTTTSLATTDRAYSETKLGVRVSRIVLAKTIAAVLVFILTLIIAPYYVDGDQVTYRKVYEGLADKGLVDGFLFYSLNTSSKEVVHFALTWVASRFIEKDLLVAFSNGILAYAAMSLFHKWKASLVISFFLVVTNFYFFSLYFAAERLKYGFIFLALSLINVDRRVPFCGFGLLAVVSHVQTLLVYGLLLFSAAVKQAVNAFSSGRLSKSLFLLPLMAIPILLVKDHIAGKLEAYALGVGGFEIVKTVFFMLLALCYAKKKGEVILLFIPIMVVVLMVGGFRINVFGYFVFLYYGLQSKGGWNFGVLATSAYFAYGAMVFVANIFQYGHGFP